MPNVLALDLATSTGWAVSEGENIFSGVQDFSPQRGESSGMRFVRFNRWLREIGAKADLIVFEQAHYRGGHATEVLAGLAALTVTYCSERGINHLAVHTATLKRFATGKGNADKRAMLAAVRERWKATVQSDDEADALALLQYALQEIV